MNRTPENKLFKVTLETERTYTVRVMHFHDAEAAAIRAAVQDETQPSWQAKSIVEVSV